MTGYPPLRREVLVDADPAVAFEVFTTRVGRWWPLAAGFGVYRDGTVAFAGGQIIERSAGGQIIERSAGGRQAVWGTVTRWEPPHAVAPQPGLLEAIRRAGADGRAVVIMPHAEPGSGVALGMRRHPAGPLLGQGDYGVSSTAAGRVPGRACGCRSGGPESSLSYQVLLRPSAADCPGLISSHA